VPDDIDGLPSTRQHNHLASDPDLLLYEAELDNGRAWRCIRPFWGTVVCFPVMIAQAYSLGGFSCDEVCCWVRKEYSTRSYYRVSFCQPEAWHNQQSYSMLIPLGSIQWMILYGNRSIPIEWSIMLHCYEFLSVCSVVVLGTPTG
jgi:hypothetical protein